MNTESDKLSEELKKIHECGDCGNYLKGLSEKAEALENRSSGATEGVPKGWKIKRIGKPIIHKETFLNAFGDITFCQSNMGDNKVYVIIERDVQIIDMSQCKVDIQYRNSDQEHKNSWSIIEYDALDDNIFIDESDIRVRQDHYFSLSVGEREIPDGLHVSLKLHGFDDHCTIYRSEDLDATWKLGTMRGFPVLGVKVLGAHDGYAYAHELNKVEN